MKMNLVRAVVVVMFIGTCGAMNQQTERSTEELKKEHLDLIIQKYNLEKQIQKFETKKYLEDLKKPIRLSSDMLINPSYNVGTSKAKELADKLDFIETQLGQLCREAIPGDVSYYHPNKARWVSVSKERMAFMIGQFRDLRRFSHTYKNSLRSKL